MHWSLTGITGCGKSRLLKETIIPAHRRAGRWVGVLDPLGAQWPADWCTDDPMRFVAAARASRSCVWVVDEFRHFAKNWDALMELEWLFTIGRNHGHLCYAVAQRMMMVPPNVRDQCSHAVVFQQPRASLQHLVDQMNCPGILEAESLPKGTAIVVEPFENPRKIKLF